MKIAKSEELVSSLVKCMHQFKFDIAYLSLSSRNALPLTPYLQIILQQKKKKKKKIPSFSSSDLDMTVINRFQ